MKNLMSLVAAEGTEELIVNLLDGRILVRLTKRLSSVVVIESLSAETAYIYEVANLGINERLSAAVDAAARASHDLDEGVRRSAGLDLIHDDTMKVYGEVPALI